MAKYQLTHKAVDDLTEIWRYTAETWSESQADNYYKLIIEGIEEIARRPETGKEYGLIEPGLRGVKVGRHILFYLIANKKDILVIRILHDRMDLLSKF